MAKKGLLWGLLVSYTAYFSPDVFLKFEIACIIYSII